jgi:ribosomal protein S18 acetylase RimI-like enzyme
MLSTRQAVVEDSVFLEDVFLQTMRMHITAARGFWDEAKERSQFREQLQFQHTRIIERNGARVGFLMTVERNQDIELHTLCIVPDCQRQGLGTAITRQILNDAHAKKCGVVLSVLKPNTAARLLYERLGFIITEESVHHYRMRFGGVARDF